MAEKIIGKEQTLFDGDPAVEVRRPVARVYPADERKPIRIRPVLMALSMGEEAKFPIEKMRSIRAIASDLGVIMDRRYQTRIDRETRTISVTRTA